MAGIGFDLRRLVQDDSFLSRLRAYAAAGLIAAGPWLVTMASLWLVRIVATSLSAIEIEHFLSVVGAVFAASLVTMSGVQMAITRHLADELYGKSYGGLLPAFSTAATVTAAVQALSGALLCQWLGFEPALTVATTLLYVAVSLSWLAMAWLTVIRQHDKVLIAYVLGGLGFVLMVATLGEAAGLADVVFALALGNGLIVALMGVLIARGTEPAESRGSNVFAGVLRHRVLFFAGTAYGLSLWIDKAVFWWLDGQGTLGLLRHHPLYDACFYLGYLTVVPALAQNLVHLETEFYERYRDYFAAATGNATLAEIRRRGERMVESLAISAARLLRIQGAVTLACIALAGPIVAWCGLPPFAAHVLRLFCLGAFCHVLLLLTVLVLLYFDRSRAALRACTVFLTANGVLAWVSVELGPETYGAGFTLAALLGLAVALLALRRTFVRLEFLTFMRQ